MKKIIIVLLSIIVLICAVMGIYYVFQLQKNVDTMAEVIQEENDEPPVIILKGDKDITLNEGESYKEQGYSATDDRDGSLVKNVKVEKKNVTDTQYNLVYTVADSSGNIAKEERHVKFHKKKKNKGVIYLTFDDGPSSNTNNILDILKEEKVKATFFLLNYEKSQENLVQREFKEGHALGIHGYSHDYGKIYKSVDAYMENLDKLQKKIYQTTGKKVTITRFPGGSSNTISDFNPGIMSKLCKEIGKKGYKYCDWNVDSEDAGGARNSDEIYKNVIKDLRKDRNNVVLMHDASDKINTVKALRKIIKYGKEHGYTFDILTPETEMVHHGIAN